MSWKNRIVGHDEVYPQDLLANPYNHRIHSQIQEDHLKSVLDDIGWIAEVTVNRTSGHIIDGHLRVALAEKEEQIVPVRYVELNEEEEKAAILTFDYISSEARIDKGIIRETVLDTMEHFEWPIIEHIAHEFNLDVFGDPPEDPGPEIDKAEELREKWGVEIGQLWQLGDHRIICGDCTDKEVVDRLMGDEMVELLWTDPPYHVGKVFEGGFDEGVEWDNDFQKAWQESCKPYVDNGCQRYVCFAPAQSTRAILEYHPQRLLIWCKPFALMRSNSWDWAYEFVSWSYDGESPEYFVKPEGTNSFDWQKITSVIHGQEGKHHITQKPIALPSLHIEASCPIDGKVLDPFLGSGTTLIACERLNRKCYGIEIEPKYIAVTLERWSQMTEKEPILLDK